MPGTALRPLSELISVYHNSVGRNTVMELDFAIDRRGQVDPAHAALYAQFGSWIRECYGNATATGELDGSGSTVLEIQVNTAVDRVVLQEDQSEGQRVLQYQVTLVQKGGDQSVFSQGRSIGNKKIDLGHSATGMLRLEVQRTALNLPPKLRFSAFAPCRGA